MFTLTFMLVLLGVENPNALPNGDYSVWTNYKGSGIATESAGTPPGSLPDNWYGGPGVGGKATYDGIEFDPKQTEVPGHPKRYLRVHWHKPPSMDWPGETHHQGALRFTFLEYFGIKDVRIFAGKTVVMSFWAKVDHENLRLIPIMWHSYDGVTPGIAGVKGKGYELFESAGQPHVVAIASGKPNPAAVCELAPKWTRFEKWITFPSIKGKNITAGHYTGVGFDLDSRFTGSIDLANVEVRAQKTDALNVRQPVSSPSMSRLADAMVMAPLLDGRLISVSDRAGPNGHEAIARYSLDGGQAWSAPETLVTLPTDMGNWGLHNVLVDHHGELHLFYQTDAKTAGKGLYEMRFDIYHVGSANGRKSWKAPVLVRQGYNGSMLSVIELKGGRIILPICYLTPRVWSNRGKGFDAFTDMGRFSSGVVYSDNGGDTWQQAAVEFKVPSPYIGADGMIEPIALELKDGRVWLLLRTQLGRLFECFSRDGAIWTKPTATSIFSSDSPPSLTRLKDGRIVMLWNNCLRYCYAQGGRHVLHAAISKDDGHTWRGYREVARNPFVDEPPPPNGDHGVSYTLPVLTNNGDIITPLSVGGTGGMWLMRFNPEWLNETSRKTDFSVGAEGWNSFGTKGVEVVANPDKPGARALQLRKPDADWPSAAVWNFPNGMNGRLRIRLKLNPGFAGARVALTDHFSVAFDPEDQYYNLFNLSIGPEGKLQKGEIQIGQWHTLELEWNTEKQECRIFVDGRSADTLPMQRRTTGVNYLRLCSTVEKIDSAGLLIESVDASVSE